MRTREDDQESRLATRKLMRERGIALDPLGARAARVLKLDVSQDVAPLTSMLFRAEAALECCLWVKIVNHTAEPIDLKHVSLELPFTQERFAWLEDPLRVSAKSFYQLPFSRDSFSRGDVINHLLRKKLLPGVPIAGFLLGVIHQPIPEQVAGQIVGRLRLMDRTGRGNCQRVSLFLDTRVFRRKPAISPVECDGSSRASVNGASR